MLVSMDFSVGLGLTACDFVDPSAKPEVRAYHLHHCPGYVMLVGF